MSNTMSAPSTPGNPNASGPGAGVLDTPQAPTLPTGYQPPPLPPNATDAQKQAAAWAYYQANPGLQTYIQQTDGDESWAMAIPELAKIIVAAGIYGMAPGEIDAAVSSTNWYKGASQSMRYWEALKATDPAS